MFISEGLATPYYAVIFASVRAMDNDAYDAMSEEMNRLVQSEEGFLGMESAREADGRGVTVCYWRSRDDIRRWKENTLHRLAQERGKNEWYEEYSIKIAEVTESYDWKR